MDKSDDYCPSSTRVDGKKHSWKFDGDDPYIICFFCGEIRDALSGKVIPATQPSTHKESWEDKQVLQNTIARMATRENHLYPGKTEYILNQDELDRLYDLYHSLISSAVNAEKERISKKVDKELRGWSYMDFGSCRFCPAEWVSRDEDQHRPNCPMGKLEKIISIVKE